MHKPLNQNFFPGFGLGFFVAALIAGIPLTSSLEQSYETIGVYRDRVSELRQKLDQKEQVQTPKPKSNRGFSEFVKSL
jgi:hypothetical protein